MIDLNLYLLYMLKNFQMLSHLDSSFLKDTEGSKNILYHLEILILDLVPIKKIFNQLLKNITNLKKYSERK